MERRGRGERETGLTAEKQLEGKDRGEDVRKERHYYCADQIQKKRKEREEEYGRVQRREINGEVDY